MWEGISPMYERFTKRARRVMLLTEDESQRFNHEYIGTEHILLGLVKEVNGGAATILETLDVDQDAVRVAIEQLLPVGPKLATKAYELPFTPRATKAVSYALEEVQRLDHPSVGTQHLLIGLLRESEGVACQVLGSFGVMLVDARVEAMKPIDDDLGMPIETRSRRRWFQLWRSDRSG